MKLKLTILFTLLSVFGIAQTPDGKKEFITIKSDVYKTDRKITVFLPPYYEEYKNEKLNVVYVFDGQFEPLFNFVSNSISYLSAIGEINNMIVVGIYSDDRRKEFTPMPESEEGKAKWKIKQEFGFSNLLDKHLVNEVFPLIEKTYNVNKYRIGIGHSLGGTYLINSFAENQKLFNSYIAVSPNLEFENNQIQNKIKKLLLESTEINAFVNISIGSLDETELKFTKGIKVLDTIFNNSKTKGLKFRFDYLTNTNHSTSPFLEIPVALLELGKVFKKPSDEKLLEMLNNKNIDFIVNLKNYYTEKSNWFGYNYLPSENEVNSLAYFSFNNKNPKESLKIINWAIELYPNGINLYDSKAEILEKLNQKKEAENVVKFALEKLEKIKNEIEDYDYYKEMLEKHITKK